MNLFNKLNLNQRASLFLITMEIVFFTIFGILIYNSQKSVLKEKATEILKSEMDDLVNIIQLQNQIDSVVKISQSKIAPAVLLQVLNNTLIDETMLYQSLNQIISIEDIIETNKNIAKQGKKILYRNVFYDKRYFKDGFAFCMNTEGKVVYHPFSEIEGQDYSNEELFIKIAKGEANPIQYVEKINNEDEKKWAYYYNLPQNNWIIAITTSEAQLIGDALSNLKTKIILSIILATLFFFFIMNYLIKEHLTRPIKNIVEQLKKLSQGQHINQISFKRKDEIGSITDTLNQVVNGLRTTSEFAKNIGKGNLDAQFNPLSEEDVLGNSLLEMRESLKKASIEDEKRKLEDQKRSWATHGLAKFGDILRQDNDKLDVLSFNIVKNLVEYLEINIGGMFILNDDNPENLYLELVATYAYDRKKFLEKSINIGEGLVGACFKEKGTIYLREVPDDYVTVSSGFGENIPNELLVVPLKLNDQVYGVIELATFKDFEPHEIEFIEKVGESIASTISSVKINIKTTELLEKSQQQAEEMRAQEEEMRQNMEELTATQEALSEKDRENQEKIRRLNEEHVRALEDLKHKEEQQRAVMQHAHDSIIIINKNGDIEYANQASLRLFEFRESEIKEKNIKHLLSDEHAENFYDNLRNFIENGDESLFIEKRTTIIRVKDGAIKETELSVSVSTLKNEYQFTLFFEDLSALSADKERLIIIEKELKKAEDELYNTEQLFKKSVSNYDFQLNTIKALFHLVLDQEFTILDINDKLLNLLHLPTKDFAVNKNLNTFLDVTYHLSKQYQNFQETVTNNRITEEILPFKTHQGKIEKMHCIALRLSEQSEDIHIYILTQPISVTQEQDHLSDFSRPKQQDNEIIRQLEDELSQALEEIDRLKAKLAGK